MRAVDFIAALQAVPDGPSMMANIVGALAEGLVDDAEVGMFLRRCAARHARQPVRVPPTSPMVSMREVSIGDDGERPWRRWRRVAEHDGLRLTTLVPWEVWYAKNVDADRVAAHGIPLIRKPEALQTHDSLAEHLDEVCALRPWWKTRDHAEPACLGGPLTTAVSVWFSTTDHDAGHVVPEADVQGSAYRLASATGLAYPAGTWLLQYSVDAAEARRVAGVEVARPLFGDGGNGWFRLRNPSPYGRHCAGLGWGNTAHLAPADVAVHNDGRPERVLLRLPLDDLSSLRLRLVGQVRAEDHDPPLLAQDTFIKFLCDGGTLDAVTARLLACCA